MPDLTPLPVPLYQPTSPYNHLIDNLPIQALETQIDLVNSQVDNNTVTLNSAIGTQGTLANFLAQSLNQDGTLKVTAIDNALHNIADHIDDSSYVRMAVSERAKLSFIADDATSLQVWVTTISSTRMFQNETMVIQPSDSIVWRTVGSNVYADTNFPSAVRHTHYYGLAPAPVNPITPNYQSWLTTSVSTAYQLGSLRVYVNGVRLNETDSVYVPFGMPGVVSYMALSYTEGIDTDGIVLGGDFALSNPIPSSANIVIDFDVLFS